MSVLTNAMNSMTSRFVTVSLVKDKKDDANKYFSSTLAANLIISFIIIIIPMTLVVIFLDKFMNVPVNGEVAIKGLFALVFSSALINISASVFGIATFAKNRIDLRSLRELVTSILKLILFALFYFFLTPSIIYVGIVAIIIAFINIVFQIYYTKILLPEITLNKKNISVRHTKELLSSSIWNAINYFGNALLAGMSMILTNILYGAAASGMFSIVNTVPQFINGIVSMLVGVFYPVLTYKYAQNDRVGVILVIKKAQGLIGVFACSVISVFSALATEFFMLWTPGEDAKHLSILSFFTIVPHFFIACMWSLTNLNVVMNKVKTPAVFTLIIGFANIIISFVIYKIWHPGIMSLSIVSSSIQIVWIGVFMPLYACKNLKIKWNSFYPALIKAFICSSISIVLIIKLKGFFIINTWIEFLAVGATFGVLTFSFFAFVMIGPNRLIRIIRTKLRK